MEWIKLFNNSINLEVLTKVAPTKGNLVYEYNPFRNYRINQSMYEYLDQLYSLGDLWNKFNICVKFHTAVRINKNNVCRYAVLIELPEKIRYSYILNGSNIDIDDWIEKNCPAIFSKEEFKSLIDHTKLDDTFEVTTDIKTFGTWIKEAYVKGKNLDRVNFEKALLEAKVQEWQGVPSDYTNPVLREPGELCDFISDELNFSLNHPVHIIPQYSYDGSVNLIINDGLNVPRLINSRFSATGKNTYEVIDRKGNNDTNIYDLGEQFDIDTSLYKKIVKIPKIHFTGVNSGGGLSVGNYYFYFKLSDADGNETDFVGESGLVSVFIGFDFYQSVTTGQKNQNSFKSVNFKISDVDSAYNYVTVYYSRSTAEGLENSITEYKKVDKKYPVNNASIANVSITGFEDTIDISPADINLNYNIVDSAYTSAQCLNMLFMGNVHKPDIAYNELSDLSLRFLPYLKEEDYNFNVTPDYAISTNNRGYIDPKFIYDKTGYWGGEIYRFGIVYILKNGELSPVFNVRGNYNIKQFDLNNLQYSNIPVWEIKEGNTPERRYINYHEEKYILLEEDSGLFENIKGVVSFNPTKDTNTIYSVDFRVDDDTIQELKKYVKGYFFVRQTRIPLVLALGITIGIDKGGRVPTIPTASGFLDSLENALDHTHVVTNDINDVNYISEGFIRRYLFKIEKTSNSLWAWIGAAIATVVLVAATVISFGAAAPLTAAAGVGMFAAVSAAASAISAATIPIVIGVGVAVGTAAIAGAIGEGVIAIGYSANKNKAQKSINGKNTEAPSFCKLVETDESRQLTNNFIDRIIIKDPSKNLILGILCPDYELNQPYYNQIFTGNKHYIELTNSQSINTLNGYSSNYFTNNDRHFYIPAYYDRNIRTGHEFKIIGVPDGVKAVGLEELIFRARGGDAEEAWKFEYIGEDYKEAPVEMEDGKTSEQINSDMVRGNYGAYLAFDDTQNSFLPAETVNIYIPEYSISNMELYFYIRMIDSSIFYAITDRFDILNIDEQLVVKPSGIVGDIDRSQGYQISAYRGDCYICLFTHRLIRNFNDPSAPYNDNIVDKNSWRDKFLPQDQEKYSEINLGDVNAILLGMWVTFKIRSSNNLNIRTLDHSFVDETSMTGHPRGYYPYYPMSVEGNYKHPDSACYNRGFSKSVSDRWNFELPDVPHIKNWFGTRIIYSDIHINDAYKNGFRTFRGTHYRDYTREYGEIVKLISFESNLLCVFEHGVALIPINERAVAGQGSGGNIYINTSNVLPENPRIISDMFGSQWPESIIKVPGKSGNAPQYVYGVDTVAKKIWRTDGNTLLCISDFRVQEFLNNNITLGEREITPIIGIRNVKTHYNAFKRDVMFTFYDNTYGFEEKVWNLCWNEILEKFITFYSWVPSYMENINNIPFSFDRNTSKWIAKLGTSHSESSFADGITLSNVIIENDNNNQNVNFPFTYIDKSGKSVTTNYKVLNKEHFIAVLSINNRVLPDAQMHYNIKYTLEKDNYGNYNNFEIRPIEVLNGVNIEDDKGNIIEKGILLPNDAMFAGKFVPLYGLYFKHISKKPIYYKNNSSTIHVQTKNKESIYLLSPVDTNSLYSELYYRNSKKHSYADYDDNKIDPTKDKDYFGKDYPIFKDISGRRPVLDNPLNEDKLVKLLNIKAHISIVDTNTNDDTLSDIYYNMKAGYQGALIDMGLYESTVAVIPRWNLQFLSTDFWKHGQGGIIDIKDDIFPTYWYGKQHPFEFEFIVVNDPAVHKLFTNLEIVSNKAKPESFHYEIIGESYDFAKDKINMYFRQEAIKALWQYNGTDIVYNRDFLKILPKQLNKSADLVRIYYSRQDKINEIEDYYVHLGNNSTHDYRHLSGGEIQYYPNRNEYRIWNHVKAIDINDLDPDDSRSIVAANCHYLEDRWKVTINPLLVCYKNEYILKLHGPLFLPQDSTWTSPNRPKLPILNSPIPKETLETIKENGNVTIPEILRELGYTGEDMDQMSWLINGRKELDLKDKYIKVKIRYSGEELVVIDFLNTIYRISYS